MEVSSLKKAEFTAFCHLIHNKGLVFGPGGNASILCGETILITPSGRSLCSLREEDIIEMDLNGGYKGNGRPSSEYGMHLACYKARPDVTAVLHVHSIYATAIACLKGLCMEKAMPIHTPGYGRRVGVLPALPYMRPGSKELAKRVGEVIGTRDSVLLKNHGLVIVGENMQKALDLTEEIEENAKLTVILGALGEELSPDDINDLANYGR